LPAGTKLGSFKLIGRNATTAQSNKDILGLPLI